MGPHQGSVEGKENLPRPAAHTLLDAPQDPIGFQQWELLTQPGSFLRSMLRRNNLKLASQMNLAFVLTL